MSQLLKMWAVSELIRELFTPISTAVIALSTIYAASHSFLERPKSALRPTTSEDAEEVIKSDPISWKFAIIMPFISGAFLLGLFWLIMKYGAEIISTIMLWHMCIMGFAGLVSSLRRVLDHVFSTKKTVTSILPRLFSGYLPEEYKRSSASLLSAIPSAITIMTTYLYLRDRPHINWVFSNIIALSAVYQSFAVFKIDSLLTGIVLLSALFFYDIYFVFFTPVMITVAKSLDIPIKVVLPNPSDGKDLSFSMLGLGDIAIPGVFIHFCLNFDVYNYYRKLGQKTVYNFSRRFDKKYFHAAIVGYLVGLTICEVVLHVTKHGQPALLYLSPGVTLFPVLAAYRNGDLKELWSFTIISDDDADDKDSADVKIA